MFTSKDIVVIGGGISGLSTAYRLQRKGLNVLLLEAKQKVGGSICTEHSGDFLVDYGPNSTLETSVKISAFIEELGLNEKRLYANNRAKRRYILKKGRLQALPMSPAQFLMSGLFSTKAKMRLLAEPFIGPAAAENEESIAGFVERRLGREFLDYAINPFVAGVYAGDPVKLSVRSAVPKVFALEEKYGSLIKGAIKGAKARKKSDETEKTKARLFSFKLGMSELPAALAARLGDAVSTNSRVQSVAARNGSAGPFWVNFSRDGVEHTVEAEAVITTVPAYTTAQLFERMDKTLSTGLNDIEYPPVAMVFLGFNKPVACRPLDGFGFLVPEIEQRNILGTIWNSTLFPQRAPRQGMALTTFVGGARQPELALLQEAELEQLVRDELQQIMGLEGEPDAVKIKQWKRAIPQYSLGHAGRMQTVDRFEAAHPGLFISGNFRGGISVGDCIVSSEKTAETAFSYLKKGAKHALQK